MVGHAKPVWDSETHGNRPDIARQRLIALQFTQAKEQPPAAAGMTRYEAHPLAPLAPGEYALLTRGRIYDFGVDP
jgi:hypothetical protein